MPEKPSKFKPDQIVCYIDSDRLPYYVHIRKVRVVGVKRVRGVFHYVVVNLSHSAPYKLLEKDVFLTPLEAQQNILEYHASLFAKTVKAIMSARIVD